MRTASMVLSIFVVPALALASGCSLALDPSRHLSGTCDLITQTGCAAGERCTYAEEVGVVCAPAGSLALHASCSVEAGVDECAAGLACDGATCRRICSHDAAACDEAESCVRGRLGAGAGLCLPDCNPISQLRPDGTTCPVGQACYPWPDSGLGVTQFVCGRIGTVEVGQTIMGTPSVNSCVPGAIVVGNTCAALCTPTPTSLEHPEHPEGIAPHPCTQPNTECVYLWGFGASVPTRDERLNQYGFCFDRTGFTYDDDGDHVDDGPWPSCSTRTEADSDDEDPIPENMELSCAPAPLYGQ